MGIFGINMPMLYGEGERAFTRLQEEYRERSICVRQMRLTRKNQSPLLRAAAYGHEAMVKLLLENGAELEPKDGSSGRTPLSWAAEKRARGRC
jgi:hypothetical protein